MPIYDYLCTECDHRADILHGINDPGPNFCPSCGAEGTMRKQFAAPAIHFKGSGWAKKDRGGSSATKASRAGSDGTDAKGDQKHETKGETKGEQKGDPGQGAKSEAKSPDSTSSSGGSSAATTD